jgi:hypothetical protein
VAPRSISVRVEVPTDTLYKKMEELVDEVMGPIRTTLTDADIRKLRDLCGDDITRVNVGSFHAESEPARVAGPPIVMTAYASRLWSKATCA